MSLDPGQFRTEITRPTLALMGERFTGPAAENLLLGTALAESGLEKDTIVVVRPWKFPLATTMTARPSGTPLTSYPHLRAILIPVSTASAPVLTGSTCSLPTRSASAATNGANRSWWKARLVRVIWSS